MVRPRDDAVHAEFDPIAPKPGAKTPRKRCRHCGVLSGGQLYRMKKHLSKCETFRHSKAPEVYAGFMVDNGYATIPDLVALYGDQYSRRVPSTRPPTTPGPSASKKRKTPASSSKAATKKAKAAGSGGKRGPKPKVAVNVKADIDYKLAKLVHVHGSSFDMFNTMEGKNALKALNSGYSARGPPSLDEITGNLIAQHSEEVKQGVINELTSAMAIGLTTNGWNGMVSDHHHNMVCCPVPSLISSTPTSTASELSMDVNNSLKTVLQWYDEKHKSRPKFVGICTDSTPEVNNALQQHLQAQQDLTAASAIMTYGCVVQGLAQHIADICTLGHLPQLVEQATVVANAFRNIPAAQFHLQRMLTGSNRPSSDVVLPTDHTCTSVIDCFESLQQLRREIVKVQSASLEEDYIEQNAYPHLNLSREFDNGTSGNSNTAGPRKTSVSAAAIINDGVFWQRLSAAIVLLKPVAFCQSYLRTNDLAPLSMVPMTFVLLQHMYKDLGSALLPWSGLDVLGLTQHDAKHQAAGMLFRCWSSLFSHDPDANDCGPFASMLQLALMLDSATCMAMHRSRSEDFRIDKNASMVTSVMYAAVLLARVRGEQGTNEQLVDSDTATKVKALILAGRNASEDPFNGIAESVSHPLNQYCLESGPVADMAMLLFQLPCSTAAGADAANAAYIGAQDLAKSKGKAGGLVDVDELARLRVNAPMLGRRNAYLEKGAERSRELMEFFHAESFGDINRKLGMLVKDEGGGEVGEEGIGGGIGGSDDEDDEDGDEDDDDEEDEQDEGAPDV